MVTTRLFDKITTGPSLPQTQMLLFSLRELPFLPDTGVHERVENIVGIELAPLA